MTATIESSALPATAAWRPLLDGSLAAQALDVIGAIRAALDREDDGPPDIGEEQALFERYAQAIAPDAQRHARATERLETALDAIAAGALPAQLHTGLVGVAWVAHHVGIGDDVCEAVDEVLLEYARQSPWTYKYDLMSGLAGYGMYALERWPRARARLLVREIILRLDELALRLADGVTWLSRAELYSAETRALFPQGYYDVGLGHGVPGVIAFLAASVAADVEATRARRLLDGGVEWLLAQRLAPDAATRYPSRLDPAGGGRDPSRAAWCYGDAGIAAALFAAGRAAGSPALVNEALTIALRLAGQPFEYSGVVDGGLCHGAAGLGHMFNRLYQASGDARLGEAARRWFERLFQLRRPGEPIAGFPAWTPRGAGGALVWAAERGLLVGASGLGLALVAAISTEEPAWDRLFAVSLPARCA